MTTALAWIRKSKGSDDDLGLELQREQVTTQAEELADDYNTLDLGVQTGFSSLSRDDTGLLDQRDDVQEAVDDIRDGRYDLLVAYDDRRICRDDYLSVIEYACVQGDCEMVFVSDDVETDDLAYDIHRRVEQKTKEEEIDKAKAAIAERQSRGYWQGGEPFGLQFDDNGQYLVPDDDYDRVMKAFEMVDDHSYREIEDELGISKATLSQIFQRGREFYAQRAE
jgi:DNA invertase Pin-like site-specific DNA recombinase